MTSAVTDRGSSLESDLVRRLFGARPRRVRWPYAVAPDGERFLVNTLADQTSGIAPSNSVAPIILAPVTVVVNWTAEKKN